MKISSNTQYTGHGLKEGDVVRLKTFKQLIDEGVMHIDNGKMIFSVVRNNEAKTATAKPVIISTMKDLISYEARLKVDEIDNNKRGNLVTTLVDDIPGISKETRIWLPEEVVYIVL